MRCEHGTADIFLMADQVLDVTKYYRDGMIEITWKFCKEKREDRIWQLGKEKEHKN